jgi:hypothetical protein
MLEIQTLYFLGELFLPEIFRVNGFAIQDPFLLILSFVKPCYAFLKQGHPGIDAITMPYFGIDRGSQPGILAVNTGQIILCIWRRTARSWFSIQKCFLA